MFRIFCLFYFVEFLLVVCSSSKAETSEKIKIGAIIQNGVSRVAKEQRIAIQMAYKDFHLSSSHNVELLLVDSYRNSAPPIGTALDLISNKQVKAIIGSLSIEEVSLIFQLNKTSIDIPIISLASPSLLPPSMPIQMTSVIRMTDDINHHTQCIAAIIGNFQWRKVTAIYEDRNDFTTNMAILNLLSNSLKDVNSEIENHIDFSSSDTEAVTEEKLKNIRSKSNRVFIVVQSSIEFATLLFHKAKKLKMMGNGYVWIVSDEIGNLVDSLDSSTFYNMEGVIGCRNYVEETKDSYKRFKTKFRRMFMTEYLEDEGENNPSFFALRAYDAYWAIASAIDKMEIKGNFSGKEVRQKVLESKFQGMSGLVRFKKGILSQLQIFQIINVFGRSYKEIAYWSLESGFYDKITKEEKRNSIIRNVNVDLLGLIHWPGGKSKKVPKGWDFSNVEKRMKIGVPMTAAFKEFVHVNYNDKNVSQNHFSGFSISVFRAVVDNLPYYLPFDFVPFNGSYDDLLSNVTKKVFEGAVGDFGIFSHRLELVDFTEPYLDNAAVMIVKEEPPKWPKVWIFVKAFTAKMWLSMFFMHIFVSSVIWVIERKHNDDLKGVGNMLWFSVAVIFFVHREPVKNGLARLVLGPWLFVILIITSSFTASLSSMITISRTQPSILDIETLKIRNETVGCNKNSVMVRFLTQVLQFNPDKVKQLSSIDKFPEAFKNGEIKAAFFSGPHADVFLAKHCNDFAKTVVFKLVGMGFAFPKGSPLTMDISTSIADLLERREMPNLETTMISTFNCSSSDNNIYESGLGPEHFAGLFIISGGIAAMAILFTTVRLAVKMWRNSMEALILDQEFINYLKFYFC